MLNKGRHTRRIISVGGEVELSRRYYWAKGADGVMVATVTQLEKDKRRKAHAVRRQQRSATGVGNAKDLVPARPGSDDRYKEMKIGVFYDQQKKHRHAFVTEAASKTYGPLLKVFAAQIGFELADEQLSLVDGAKWIARQVCSTLLLLHLFLLDFYHMSQHLHAAARCCLGGGDASGNGGNASSEKTLAAKQWVEQRLAEIKEQGVAPVLVAIDALKRQVRSAVKRKSLDGLRNYLTDRLEMLDYRRALANGWDIGSGPTEAMCKTLTMRLKQPGMKWDRDHAAAMMNMQAMYESGQAAKYWEQRSATA